MSEDYVDLEPWKKDDRKYVSFNGVEVIISIVTENTESGRA